MRDQEKAARGPLYCGHLIDDRRLTPLTVAWATIVALWFLVYLVGCVGRWRSRRRPKATAQWSTSPSDP